jgi:hypothetical protein
VIFIKHMRTLFGPTLGGDTDLCQRHLQQT